MHVRMSLAVNRYNVFKLYARDEVQELRAGTTCWDDMLKGDLWAGQIL
jgi:hypothetical protein